VNFLVVGVFRGNNISHSPSNNNSFDLNPLHQNDTSSSEDINLDHQRQANNDVPSDSVKSPQSEPLRLNQDENFQLGPEARKRRLSLHD
jgi:hypothetical protein